MRKRKKSSRSSYEDKKAKREQRERQREEYLNNAENIAYYDSLIPSKKELIENLAIELPFQLNISKYLKRIKKDSKSTYKDLISWYKYPYHLNCACNIYKVAKNYKVDDELLSSVITHIFDLYENPAFMLLSPNDKQTYKDSDVEKELIKRGFVELSRFKELGLDIRGNYIIHNKLGLIYPKSFNEPYFEHTKKIESGIDIHKAQFLYGLQTSIYYGNDKTLRRGLKLLLKNK